MLISYRTKSMFARKSFSAIENSGRLFSLFHFGDSRLARKEKVFLIFIHESIEHTAEQKEIRKQLHKFGRQRKSRESN